MVQAKSYGSSLKQDPRGIRVRVIARLYYDPIRAPRFRIFFKQLEHYVKKIGEKNSKVSQLTYVSFMLRNTFLPKHFLLYYSELKMQLLLIKLIMSIIEILI